MKNRCCWIHFHFSARHLRPEVELMHFTAYAQTLLSCLKHMALDRLHVCLNIILFYGKLFPVDKLSVNTGNAPTLSARTFLLLDSVAQLVSYTNSFSCHDVKTTTMTMWRKRETKFSRRSFPVCYVQHQCAACIKALRPDLNIRAFCVVVHATPLKTTCFSDLLPGSLNGWRDDKLETLQVLTSIGPKMLNGYLAHVCIFLMLPRSDNFLPLQQPHSRLRSHLHVRFGQWTNYCDVPT